MVPGTAPSHLSPCRPALEKGWPACVFLFCSLPSVSGSFSGKGLSSMIIWIPSWPGLKKYFLIYLAALSLGCSMSNLGLHLWHAGSFFFNCVTRTLSCGMWDLVPWSGIKHWPPALGARSLSHWTTREVPRSGTLSVPWVSLEGREQVCSRWSSG